MQRFDSIEEAREFHRDLLSKPFTFKTEIGASEENNGATDFKSPEYETFVVTVFPQHPDVPPSFLEELVQAKDAFEKKQSCYLVIDFRSALAKWYKERLQVCTGKKWVVHCPSNSIVLYNSPMRIDFLGSVCWVLFCVSLCPLWFCVLVYYTWYGFFASKWKRFTFDFQVAVVLQCVI